MLHTFGTTQVQRAQSSEGNIQSIMKNDILNKSWNKEPKKKHLFGTEDVAGSCICAVSPEATSPCSHLGVAIPQEPQKPKKGRRQAKHCSGARAHLSSCGFPLLCQTRSACLTDGCSHEVLLDQSFPTFSTFWHAQKKYLGCLLWGLRGSISRCIRRESLG